MLSLLKEYILLEIKAASFQSILNKVRDENEAENDSSNHEPDAEPDSDKRDLNVLMNMSIPHNPLKTINNKIIKNDQ